MKTLLIDEKTIRKNPNFGNTFTVKRSGNAYAELLFCLEKSSNEEDVKKLFEIFGDKISAMSLGSRIDFVSFYIVFNLKLNFIENKFVEFEKEIMSIYQNTTGMGKTDNKICSVILNKKYDMFIENVEVKSSNNYYSSSFKIEYENSIRKHEPEKYYLYEYKPIKFECLKCKMPVVMKDSVDHCVHCGDALIYHEVKVETFKQFQIRTGFDE